MRFCLMGGPIKIKPGVVPHIFSCQPNRKRTANHHLRLAFEKQSRKAQVPEILAATECSSLPDAAKKENTTPNIHSKFPQHTASVRFQTFN